MKRILTFIFCLSLWVMASMAQTQQGYVKTKGRLGSNGTVIAGTRLPGATVTVKGGNAVVSGNKGIFTLAIPSNNYYLQNVQKEGYVLTDPDVLAKQYAYSKNPLVLVLETPQERIDDKLATEKKIRHTLQRQLQEKEDEIETLKEQNKISEEEYRKQLQEIFAHQESNEKLISEMADRYSKIDYDQLDEFNARISQLILDGKLTEADSLLNTKGDINNRAAALRQHQAANAQAEEELLNKQKKLEKSKDLAQKELEDLAQDCYSKYEIFKMQHKNDSATYYIELRAELDTMDVKWQKQVFEFLIEYISDFPKAKLYAERMLRVSLERDGEHSINTAESLNRLGTILYFQGLFDEALDYYNKALDLQQSLSSTPTRELVGCYICKGNIYNMKSQICAKQSKDEQAREFRDLMRNSFSDALNICKTIENVDADILAECYYCVGYAYMMEDRQNYFNPSQREYADKCAESATANFQMAISEWGKEGGLYTGKIGISYMAMSGIPHIRGDFDTMKKLLDHAYENMVTSYGEHSPMVATCLMNKGTLYADSGDTKDAATVYRRAFEIRNKVLGEEHYDTKNAKEQMDKMENLLKCNLPKDLDPNYISAQYRKDKDYDKAITKITQARQVLEESCKDDIFPLIFLQDAMAYICISEEKYEDYIEATKMETKYYEESGDSLNIKNALAYYRVGKVYSLNLKDHKNALLYLQKSCHIREKAEDSPSLDRAGLYKMIGDTYVELGQAETALLYYCKAHEIREAILGKEHESVKEMKQLIDDVKSRQQ